MDQHLKNVKQFHEIFGCHINPAPGFPELDALDRLELKGWANMLARLGKNLFGAAVEAGSDNRGGLALLLTRLQLHVEETAELAQAMADESLLECLDSLTDIDFVTNGTYLTLGLAALKAEAHQAVHSANMSKLDENGQPIINEAGRVVKGPNYAPPTPRLKALIDQALGVDAGG